jgi:hypothetical protein
MMESNSRVTSTKRLHKLEMEVRSEPALPRLIKSRGATQIMRRLMAKSKYAGSDALPKRISAFGGLLVILIGTGTHPIVSIVVALIASVILAKV